MKISLIQWNAYYHEDIRNVARFLLEQDADIVCLQELTIDYPHTIIKDGPRFITEQLGFQSFYKQLPIESTDGEALFFANGIFSRFPIVNRRAVWINESKAGGGYDDEYRAYVEVTLDISGKELSVATTHMSYTHRFEDTPNKERETANLVKLLAQHDKRFIFTGDLNAVPDSNTITAISKVLQPAGPTMVEKTWTTKPFSYNGFEATKRNWRLDYAFTTSDVQVLSAEILETNYSDHLPLRLEIEL